MGLRGLPPDGWVVVDCAICRRRGRSRVAGLVARHGPDIADLDLLRALTRACRHQHDPAAGKRRKYVPTCLATISLPAPLHAPPQVVDLPIPAGVPFTIETWARTGGGIELHLSVVYPLDAALVAFQAACALWPDAEITLRQGARILRHANAPVRDLPGGSSP